VARSGEGGCWVRLIVVVVAMSWCRCVGVVAAPFGVGVDGASSGVVVKGALVVVVAGGGGCVDGSGCCCWYCVVVVAAISSWFNGLLVLQALVIGSR
jgi:hypothetical protein